MSLIKIGVAELVNNVVADLKERETVSVVALSKPNDAAAEHDLIWSYTAR